MSLTSTRDTPDPRRPVVEIEIGVLGKQCLDRRMPDRETLQREIAYWERRRNAEGARVEGVDLKLTLRSLHK